MSAIGGGWPHQASASKSRSRQPLERVLGTHKGTELWVTLGVRTRQQPARLPLTDAGSSPGGQIPISSVVAAASRRAASSGRTTRLSTRWCVASRYLVNQRSRVP
jgi:hypothetical protein